MKKRGFLDEMDEFPPIMCRVLARHRSVGRSKVTPMSIKEISARSGIGLGKTKWILKQHSWRGIAPETVDAIWKACDLDRSNLYRQRLFLKYEYNKPVPMMYLEKLRSTERRRLNRHFKS